MIRTTYDYLSGSGFVFDASKVGFAGSAAVLLLNSNPGQSFAPVLASSTYDSSLLELVGGVLRQKDQRPNGATFYAAWSTALNANWSTGSAVVTPANGAAVAGGVLDLSGSTNKSVTMVGQVGNAQQGTVEFQVTPQYSGTPATEQIFYAAAAGSTGNSLLTLVEHYTDGAVYFGVLDASGTPIVFINAAWVPVAGHTYTFRATWDGTGGVNGVTIDGSSLLSSAATYTRAGTLAFTVIGIRSDIVEGNANFKIANLATYPAAVTPASPTLTPTIYAAATAALPLFTYAGVGDVQAWVSFGESDSGTPAYTLNGKYWNGTAWSASNGSYAQASPRATVAANIAALPAADTVQVAVVYQASNAQSNIGAMAIGFTGQIYPTSDPTIAPNIPITMDELGGFTSTLTAGGSDGVRFFLQVGQTSQWWNGSAWAVSNGTYAQANDPATINTNGPALPISLGAFVTPVAVLHSATGATTPSLTNLHVTYDYFGPSFGQPNLCTVFGYVIDSTGAPIVGAIVTAAPAGTFFNQGLIQGQVPINATTNAMGYFSLTLSETTTAAVRVTFSVKYPGAAGKSSVLGNALIPNAPSANIQALGFSS